MGGVKIGSFGTGSGYSYYRSESGVARDQQNGARIFFVLVVLFGLITAGHWIYREIDYSRHLDAVKEVTSKSMHADFPVGQEGLLEMFRRSERLNGKRIHLSGLVVNAEPLEDAQLGTTFLGVAQVNRQTEYCQWREVRHENRVPVGKDDRGETIYRVDVSFTYHLGWLPHRVSSLLFHNTISYHNPQRDPVPSTTHNAAAKLGNPHNAQLAVAPDLLVKLPTVPWMIPYDTRITQYAWEHGFYRANDRYFYSVYERSRLGVVGQAAAGLLLEGVVDLGIEGHCTPGDIRVSYTVAPYPETVSVLGVFENGNLLPIPASNGKSVLLSAPGTTDVDGIQEHAINTVYSERSSTRVWHSIILAICTLLWWCLVRMNAPPPKSV